MKRRYRRKVGRRRKGKRVTKKVAQQVLARSAKRILNKHSARDMWIANMLPPRRQTLSPFPDIWLTEVCLQMQMSSAAGNITVNGQHFEICANNPYGTFSSGINVTNSSIASTAASGGWVYPAGQFANDSYPWFGAFANMYQRYIVYESKIVIKPNIASGADAMEYVLAPVTSNTLAISNAAGGTCFRDIAEFKHAKKCVIRPFGSSQESQTLVNKFRLNEFIGTTQSIEELIGSGTGFSGAMGAPPAANYLNGYALAFRTCDGIATATTVALDFRCYFKCALFSPVNRAV